MNLDRPLVVFDLETTGLFPKKDRIIELGAIKVMPDGTEEAQCWLLNPGIPIPPESSSVHGITDDVVKNCPTFAERADEIFAFFEGCDLGGFNSDRYDIPCLEEEFARVGRNFGVSQRRCIDVQRIYHKMEPRDLTAAVRFYLGRDHAGAHGAEADTRATLDVLKAQLAKYPELPKTSEAMSEYLSPKGGTRSSCGATESSTSTSGRRRAPRCATCSSARRTSSSGSSAGTSTRR